MFRFLLLCVLVTLATANPTNARLLKFAALQEELKLQGSAPVQAKIVCVHNKGAFSMKFKLMNLTRGTDSNFTDNYMSDMKCMKIGDVNNSEANDIIQISVTPVAGNTKPADTTVEYAPNGGTIVIRCEGTTMNYSCKREDVADNLASVLKASGAAIAGSQICIVNSAWFMLQFKLKNLSSGGETKPTGWFSMNGSKCIDLATFGTDSISADDIVTADVSPMGGTTKMAGNPVRYDSSKGPVVYSCTGTTLNFSCKTFGADMAQFVLKNAAAKAAVLKASGGAMAAKSICVVNSAWFMIQFKLKNLSAGGHTKPTKWYPMNGSKCLDLSALAATKGDIVVADVSPMGGVAKTAGNPVRYDEEAGAVVYSCTGTTLNFSCKTFGADMAASVLKAVAAPVEKDESQIWCPGQDSYCDGQNDCSTSLCNCAKGKKACQGNNSVVVYCPGFTSTNYCDGVSDCGSAMCDCQTGKDLCERNGYLTPTTVVTDVLKASGGAMAAKSICVVNSAWFMIQFKLKNLSAGGKTKPTKWYPMNGSKCLDLSAFDEAPTEGDIVVADVSPMGGVAKTAGNPVRYDENAGAVVYSCTGTTLNFSCKTFGADMAASALALKGEEKECPDSRTFCPSGTHGSTWPKTSAEGYAKCQAADKHALCNVSGYGDLCMYCEANSTTCGDYNICPQGYSENTANKDHVCKNMLCNFESDGDMCCKKEESMVLKSSHAAMNGSKICIVNSAWFMLQFKVKNLSSGGETKPTDWFAMNGSKCLDLGSLDPKPEDNDIIVADVSPMAGTTKTAGTPVKYDSKAGPIVYSCTGTTLNFSCKTFGADSDQLRRVLNSEEL